MKHDFQSGSKLLILGSCSFGRTFCSAAGSTVLLCRMALKQECVDVVLGIFPAVLMKDPGAPCKTHRCQSIILSDDEITGRYLINKGEIHTVGTLIDYPCLGTVSVHLVGCVAE